MKKLLRSIAAGILVFCGVSVLPVQAADIAVKFTGPSGQGSMVFWAPATGKTNLVLTTNGTMFVTGSVTGMPNAVYMQTATNTFTYTDLNGDKKTNTIVYPTNFTGVTTLAPTDLTVWTNAVFYVP